MCAGMRATTARAWRGRANTARRSSQREGAADHDDEHGEANPGGPRDVVLVPLEEVPEGRDAPGEAHDGILLVAVANGSVVSVALQSSFISPRDRSMVYFAR